MGTCKWQAHILLSNRQPRGVELWLMRRKRTTPWAGIAGLWADSLSGSLPGRSHLKQAVWSQWLNHYRWLQSAERAINSQLLLKNRLPEHSAWYEHTVSKTSKNISIRSLWQINPPQLVPQCQKIMMVLKSCCIAHRRRIVSSQNKGASQAAWTDGRSACCDLFAWIKRDRTCADEKMVGNKWTAQVICTPARAAGETLTVALISVNSGVSSFGTHRLHFVRIF